MSTINTAVNFDLALILTMPIEQVTYTPRNISAPEGVSEVAILTESERKLFHFMVACRLSEQAFLCEYDSCDMEYKGLLYTGTNDEKLNRLRRQVKEKNISLQLLGLKKEAAEELFWSAIKIRINSLIPTGRSDGFVPVVYGDNKIGLMSVSSDKETLEEFFGEYIRKHFSHI